MKCYSATELQKSIHEGRVLLVKSSPREPPLNPVTVTISIVLRVQCGAQPLVPAVLGSSRPAWALEKTPSEKGKEKEGGVEEEGRKGKEEMRSEAMRKRKIKNKFSMNLGEDL